MRDGKGKGRVAGHTGTEAETAVMRPQAEAHLAAQKLEDAGKSLPWSLLTEPSPADATTLEFWPPER